MTYADEEFLAEGQVERPNYPTAFGITFTPRVGGLVCAILGLVGATYLLVNVVQPTWQEYQTKQSSITEKKAQLARQAQLQQQIKQKTEELEQARVQNRQVLNLFANEKTLDALLLDLNSFVKASKGTLTLFNPGEGPQAVETVVTDGSLGPEVNGKLKRKTVNVGIEGSFKEIQSIVRNFERLQSLLLIKDFKVEVVDDQGLRVDPESGKSIPTIYRRENQEVIPGGEPDLKATFKLEALMPVNQETAKAAAANPAPKPKP